MLGSTVLEVAIGLTFCYGTVALIVSTVQEALASAFRLRANTLLAGIKSMLNDPNFTGLARSRLCPSAGQSARRRHRGSTSATLKSKPSYIEPVHFAIALVDSIQKAPGDFTQLGRDIDAIPDPAGAAGDAGAATSAPAATCSSSRTGVAGWFDNAMERVSGDYKRRQLLISLLLSLLLAILFNIDSIHLFRTLWQHPALAAQHGKASPRRARPGHDRHLMALPIGWTHFPAGAERRLRAAGGGLADAPPRPRCSARRSGSTCCSGSCRCAAPAPSPRSAPAVRRGSRSRRQPVRGPERRGPRAASARRAAGARPPARSKSTRAARVPATRRPARTSAPRRSRWGRCGSRRPGIRR